MNRNIMKALSMGRELTLVDEGKCPFCKEPVKESDFEDDFDLREFRISGLCKKCQDSVFGT